MWSEKSPVPVKKNWMTEKESGLITKVRQELGNPDRIYVKMCVTRQVKRKLAVQSK